MTSDSPHTLSQSSGSRLHRDHPRPPVCLHPRVINSLHPHSPSTAPLHLPDAVQEASDEVREAPLRSTEARQP